MSSASDLSLHADSIDSQMSKFRTKRSSCYSVMSHTFSLSCKSMSISIRGEMDDYGLDALIKRCGDLNKLLRCVAYFLRAAGRALVYDKSVRDSIEISASEIRDAFNFIVAWDQK